MKVTYEDYDQMSVVSLRGEFSGQTRRMVGLPKSIYSTTCVSTGVGSELATAHVVGRTSAGKRSRNRRFIG